jgi:hypothetical protein
MQQATCQVPGMGQMLTTMNGMVGQMYTLP